MELNAPQKEAVLHKDGPCMVLAGPGSGKTAVLTRRVIELISSGIPANEILVITFTKAAATEMKERFDRLSEEIYPVTFGTFHSLFWGILQREKGYKTSDILMGGMKKRLIKEAMTKADIKVEDAVIMGAFETELSVFKNSIVSIDLYEPKNVDKDQFLRFINHYEGLKNKYHLIDFDDMLLKAHELFLESKHILNKWQNRFSYFLVDEMQDMNDLQFELIKLLSAKTENLFCVGDDDQSIYGFRGANPKLMQDFFVDFPSAKKIVLNYNYRNPINLVDAADCLISNNKVRFEKDIIATASPGKIYITEDNTPNSEAARIVSQIKILQQNGEPLDEVAILYRNHHEARFIVDSLMEENIPIFLKEKMPNIYSHFVISDIESYFQIALQNVTKARVLAILNRPNRYLHRQSVEKGASYRCMMDFYKGDMGYQKKVMAFWQDIQLISKMSPTAAINYIRHAVGYEGFLIKEAMKNQVDIAEYTAVLDFLTGVFKDCKNINKAIDKLNMLRLKVDYENRSNDNDRSGKVGLYTLHSSKGLEFKNCFIIGVNDGIIPSNKVSSTEEMEAERRLFYVGITRCKENLYISYTNKKNRDRSRFLDEMKIN